MHMSKTKTANGSHKAWKSIAGVWHAWPSRWPSLSMLRHGHIFVVYGTI